MSGLKILSAVILASIFGSCDEFFTRDVVFGGNLPGTTRGDGSGGGSGGGGSDAPADDDADGLSNETEISFGIDARTADSDHDGFDDGLEFVGRLGDPLNSRLSPTPFNRERTLAPSEVQILDIDGDGDGLGDNVETGLGTDPDSVDSDEDGYNDGLEEVAGSDPLSASSRPVRTAAPVSDGGGNSGVAPADSDGDGLADGVESLNAGRVDAKDTDGDGYSDGIEFLMGSEAANGASVPDFSASVPAGLL